MPLNWKQSAAVVVIVLLVMILAPHVPVIRDWTRPRMPTS